jgi:hypothetical protein
MSPEMTRNSIPGQVKALAMIVSIEGLIPDRRAGSSEMKSAAAPPSPRTSMSPNGYSSRRKSAAAQQP